MTALKNTLLSFAAIMIAVGISGKPHVTAITPENAAKVLPKPLMLQHCARLGYGVKDCDSRDYSGISVDLDGNGWPEFSIVNKKLEAATPKLCTLYRDEKAKFALIQKDFPCEIEAGERRAGGWLDIKGTVYPTDCEPLICDFTWSGSSYKQGACAPKNAGACGAE